MYMVREVLSCHPGKVGALLKKFRGLNEVLQAMGLAPFRLYTDVSGAPFWTLVAENEYESLDEMLAVEGRVMGDKRAQELMQGYHDLVASGRRELYRVEA